MKSFFLRYGLGSILFLALIFIGLLCIQPTYDALNDKFDEIKMGITRYVEDSFGVQVRYSSLAPSILSAFFVRNIAINDAATGTQVAKINSAFLKYNIVELLTEFFSGGDITGAFSSLVIDGLSVSFSENDNAHIRASIERFVKNLPAGETLQKERKNSFLPFEVVLKNISVSYTDARKNTVTFLLASLQFVPDSEKKIFTAQADGSFSAQLRSTGSRQFEKLGLHFNLNGSVSYDLLSFNALLSIDGLKTADFTVSRLSFAADFTDSALSVRTVQSSFPFSLVYELNTHTGWMNAKIQADAFDPSTLVSNESGDIELSRIAGSTISGVYSASYNPHTEQFSYTADGSVYIGKNLVPEGLLASFSITGNLQDLFVNASSFKSPLVDAEFFGSYNYKGKYPLGEAVIHSYILPNGNDLQAEIFIEHRDNAILLFIPQLDFNGQYLTALELNIVPAPDSADFSFQVSDYTHADTDEPGLIALEGSFLFGADNYLQSRLSLTGIYLDSIFKTAAFFAPEKTEEKLLSLANALSPYVLSNELYLSTDFKSLSFNAPAVIMANTQRDRDFLILSCSGNESNINVSQFDMLFSGQSLQASFEADIAPDYSNLLFNSVITFNTVTYNFTGTFFPGAYLGIQGDYGFEMYADFNDADQITGSMRMAGLPVRISQMLGATSITAEFDLPASGDWKLSLSQFELEELSNTIPFKPRLSFSGTADKYGLFLDTIMYTDRISVLNGVGSFAWNFDTGILDTISADIALENMQTSEKFSLVFTASNPERRVISMGAVLNQMYLSLELDIRNMSFARFLPNQTANNTLTASFSALGTLNSPFLSARIDNASVSFNGIPVAFEGVMQLNDGQLSLQNARAEVIYQTFSELEALVDLKTFTGTASGVFDGKVLQETITAPFLITLTNNSLNQLINENFTSSLLQASMPQNFTLEMLLHNMTGTLAKNTRSGIVQVSRAVGRYDFFAGADRSFTGYYLDSGELYIHSGGSLPVRFTASGSLKGTNLNVQMRDLFADVARLQPVLTYPVFHMSQGILTGQLNFSGLVSDPEFNGNLTVTEGVLTSPQFVAETAAISSAEFTVENNAILSQKPYAITKRGKLFFDIETYFDGWKFTQFKLHLQTDTDNRIKAHFNDAVFGKFTADASCNMDLDIDPELVRVTGGLYLDNTVATLSFDNLDAALPAGSSKTDTLAELQIELGKRAQLSWVVAGQPVLRALAAPQTVLQVKVDSATGNFDFKGSMVLRGGDFLYLSRSFYIREGEIIFNMNQDNIDPLISFRAETRERDESGEQVRIMLSAENQLLSQITPKISSSPPMSEYDLMALLGQVLFTDTRKTNSAAIGTLATILDYGAQATVFRKVESQLRNWLNFDIFSLRTAILQNALLQTFNTTTAGKPLTPGNFFDNSTVYIGKYFGNSLYGDALLHLSYDETKLNSDLSLGGLVFEPEIGLEMASPFATIRWSLAPEFIGATNNLWVPYVSFSLSWKFSF